VGSRVDSYDWLVSLVTMPVGYAVAGPLASSVGAAIVIGVPCAGGPGARGVHQNPAGEIAGPAGWPTPVSGRLSADHEWVAKRDLSGERLSLDGSTHGVGEGRPG
jgi:hypothetical protein